MLKPISRIWVLWAVVITIFIPHPLLFANCEEGTFQCLDSDIVRKIQEALLEKGFDPGPIDGKWGPQVKRALTEFEKQNGLKSGKKLTDQLVHALFGIDVK